MFEVGALTTITPCEEAAFTSTLSKPTPARAITFKFLAVLNTSSSICVAERINMASALTTSCSSAARSVPSTFLTSKSGPRASTVAGDSSSAIKTIGLAIALFY